MENVLAFLLLVLLSLFVLRLSRVENQVEEVRFSPFAQLVGCRSSSVRHPFHIFVRRGGRTGVSVCCHVCLSSR